jgi:hypothetical protein
MSKFTQNVMKHKVNYDAFYGTEWTWKKSNIMFFTFFFDLNGKKFFFYWPFISALAFLCLLEAKKVELVIVYII